MIQKQPKPLSGLNGDIKLTPLQSIKYGFFKSDRFPDQGNQAQSVKQQPDKGSEAFKNRLIDPETFLCHHPYPEGITADEIRIALANHTPAYTRALLCSINQIAYCLFRQQIAVTKINSICLSAEIAAKILPILTKVRYSCAWAEKQMARWWKEEMSATTFRRIRSELESWGCFVVEKVKPGSTREVTPLREVNLPYLLQIAAMAIQRLADEPGGYEAFMPDHQAGFLSFLWGTFFSGSITAPNSGELYNHEAALARKREELRQTRELQQEHSWSDELVSCYRKLANRLTNQIANLEAFLEYFWKAKERSYFRALD